MHGNYISIGFYAKYLRYLVGCPCAKFQHLIFPLNTTELYYIAKHKR